MKYIPQQDYEYISGKYHDTAKPFDPFSRFIRRDDIFSADTGLDGEAIRAGILSNDQAFSHLPHPVRKARAMEYVLKNTRIACDRRDRFPAINAVDRPLNAALISQWRNEIFGRLIPEVEKRRSQLERDGIVTIWPDYDHSVPDWERVLSLGFSGLLKESEAIRSRRACAPDEDAFFEGIRITYEAVIHFIGRLAGLSQATAGSERLAHALTHIQHQPPSTFYEALLVIYLYFMISEHIDCLQVRSLSGFDRVLYPFYHSDRAGGVSEEEIRTDLAYFLLQFAAIGNYWNQPVFLGGEKADGSTEINGLSHLFLDVYDEMGIYNPKIQIKVSVSTPKPFLFKALDMIRRGHNSIVFVSDSAIRRALTRIGVSEENARLCNVTGCYEYSPIGAYSAGMNYVNLLKPLEYALHQGRDGVTGIAAGRKCSAPDGYASFDELYAEYKRQLLAVIDQTVDTVNAFEGYLDVINPLSLLSATFPSCLESARDAIGGGSLCNDSSMMFGFLADLADSLAMIQKYVFEKRELTLSALTAMLDRNFEGSESYRLKLYRDREKYGNNKERPDSIAADITRFIASSLCGRANAEKRGGKWTCGFHVARMSYVQGEKTAASANGRRLGEELSKNISASMGQNRDGATSAILSATKIDASSFAGDAALDLGLLPSAVQGDKGLEAMYSLLTTFVQRGGHALHINAFDADTLRDAQAHPEKYEDLQIRICGWNALWNSIEKKEQDGFIRQAEGLI